MQPASYCPRLGRLFSAVRSDQLMPPRSFKLCCTRVVSHTRKHKRRISNFSRRRGSQAEVLLHCCERGTEVEQWFFVWKVFAGKVQDIGLHDAGQRIKSSDRLTGYLPRRCTPGSMVPSTRPYPSAYGPMV
jgi:hypothetical protein